MYDLDEDDDELDFLRKDVDFEARSAYRKAVKKEKAGVLGKQYTRGYFGEKYPDLNTNQKNMEKTNQLIHIVESQVDELTDNELRLQLQREQQDKQYQPDTGKYFPNQVTEI